MDVSNLKKKLSAYVSDKGYLRNVSDELLYEVLTSWENWTGSSAEFYRALGFTGAQIGPLLGKAKKYKRQGHFGDQGFKAVVLDEVQPTMQVAPGPCAAIEIVWKDGQLIRFAEVSVALDFLKKAS
jgi:hypothetical protein